jgi:hypothetical protein
MNRFQTLPSRCDEPLSNVAFKFNSRRYMEGTDHAEHQVGRCRVPVSKPVLKAPMVSALKTKI